MILICAWCGKELGEKEPLEDKDITHGICESCSDRIINECDKTAPSHTESGSKGESHDGD